jgi:DNA-directed RNA polymerase subunit alpha
MRKIKTAPLIPSEFKIDKVNEKEMILRVSPFEVGFAISVAHPLKRLLMSSSIGFAPVAIKVENASHEFDNISGMLEDISELLINLKSIRFKLKGDLEKAEVSYSFKGSKEIYGSDLNSDEVEVVTPENFLATLNDDGELNFSLVIYKGIGYIPSEDIRNSLLQEKSEYIPLDAYFTPVRKANYRIENVLVEDNPNFEEIVFEIETDGQNSPKDVFSEVLKIFEAQLSIFQQIHSDKPLSVTVPKRESVISTIKKEEKVENETSLSKDEESIVEKLLYELRDFGLKQRVANTLVSAGFRFVGDVAFMDDKELQDIKNFGAGSIKDLKDALQKMQLDSDTLRELSEEAKDEFKQRAKEQIEEKGIDE